MKPNTLFILITILLLAACGGEAPADSLEATRAGAGMRMGQGGMMARHSAPIPAAYAGLTSPAPADEAALEAGETVYTTYCATCHGDGGMGDGPAGSGLDPAPAPVAHTSQMMGDDYLFWRISEGGLEAPFSSSMPAWKAALDEDDRWAVIHYIRALGSGDQGPRRGAGGATADPAAQADQEAAMLEAAVAQEVLTQDEADLFASVHDALLALPVEDLAQPTGNMPSMQEQKLAVLVTAGAITQAQADAFADMHDRLLAAGLMQ